MAVTEPGSTSAVVPTRPSVSSADRTAESRIWLRVHTWRATPENSFQRGSSDPAAGPSRA